MQRVPAVLAFVLLALQAAVPWTSRHFVTQDGPSHVYGAVVVRELLFNPQSSYHSVYALQHRVIPNWTSTVILATLVSIVGTAHAEQVMATLIIVAAFFGFGYASRTWTPLANVLIVSAFFARGYYNFQLGIALGLFVLGYGIRILDRITPRTIALLAAGWAALFFTHLVPAVFLMFTFAMVIVWTRPRNWWLAAVSFVPAAALMLAHAATLDRGALGGASGWSTALRNFPMFVFWVTSGRAGHQQYLLPGLLCLLIWSIAVMKRPDWRSARGAIFLAAAVTFGMYLYLPDYGYGGGGEIKVRLAWIVIVLAGVAASPVNLPVVARTSFALYFAVMAAVCSIAMITVNARASRQVDDYLSLLANIPAKSTIIRMRYPGASTDLPFIPLMHQDALVAAANGSIALTNYEASSRLFPFVFQPRISPEQEWLLWSLEDSTETGSRRLRRLSETLPLASPYYVLLGGEFGVREFRTDLYWTAADLQSAGKTLVQSAGDPPFARLYH